MKVHTAYLLVIVICITSKPKTVEISSSLNLDFDDSTDVKLSYFITHVNKEENTWIGDSSSERLQMVLLSDVVMRSVLPGIVSCITYHNFLLFYESQIDEYSRHLNCDY